LAGLMAIPEAMRAKEVPPCWSGYVSTDDVDARCVERRDPVPAPRIPDVGSFASPLRLAPLRSPTGPESCGVDPQGAHFAMVSASK